MCIRNPFNIESKLAAGYYSMGKLPDDEDSIYLSLSRVVLMKTLGRIPLLVIIKTDQAILNGSILSGLK